MQAHQKPEGPRIRSATRWFIVAGCLCLLLIAIIAPQTRRGATAPGGNGDTSSATTSISNANPAKLPSRRPVGATAPARPAQEIVAEKLSRFAAGRQELVHAWANQMKLKVPEDVDRLFAAIQSEDWNTTSNLFHDLTQVRMDPNGDTNVFRLWPAILEAYGVAQTANEWPPQKLLDYGNSILDSLRPGMVYVGGTDAGRFIPTLLNDTSDGEPRVVITQNALADGPYLDYLAFQYGDRLNALNSEDSQKALDAYRADALQRFEHDQQYPDAPKQLVPGETVQLVDGHVQFSGQVSVMMINEQLLQMLLQKNPDLSFALQESFPLRSFYPSSVPLGPIMELNAGPSNPLTADAATQSLDYWRTAAQDITAGTDAASVARDSYVKLIVAQANLFQNHNLLDQATQAYQLANSLDPSDTEGVFQFVSILMKQNRFDEAQKVAQTAVNLSPNNQQFAILLQQLNTVSQRKYP